MSTMLILGVLSRQWRPLGRGTCILGLPTGAFTCTIHWLVIPKWPCRQSSQRIRRWRRPPGIRGTRSWPPPPTQGFLTCGPCTTKINLNRFMSAQARKSQSPCSSGTWTIERTVLGRLQPPVVSWIRWWGWITSKWHAFNNRALCRVNQVGAIMNQLQQEIRRLFWLSFYSYKLKWALHNLLKGLHRKKSSQLRVSHKWYRTDLTQLHLWCQMTNSWWVTMR
jgi:hypothetical protein